jgi:hypothetical protein
VKNEEERSGDGYVAESPRADAKAIRTCGLAAIERAKEPSARKIFARLGIVLTMLWLMFVMIVLLGANWDDAAGLIVYLAELAIGGTVLFLGGGYLLRWLIDLRSGG